MTFTPQDHLTDDSRQVKQGSVFIHDVGNHPEGAAAAEKFMTAAQNAGAREVITNLKKEGTTFHPAPNKVLAEWASITFPKRPEALVGVTGTNGKTSVAWFYRQLATACGKKCGSIGTLGVYGTEKKPLTQTGYTTPNAPALHQNLELLAENTCTHAALEIGSHALALHRADGVRFKAAALTNITQDHLDFHGTMEAYTAAKFRLFSELLQKDGTAVLPTDRPEAHPLIDLCSKHNIQVLTVGKHNADLTVHTTRAHSKGQDITIQYSGQTYSTTLPLMGTFQAANIATTLGLGIASALDLKDMLAALPTLKNVPGRMELVSTSNQPAVIVDYAHTADALETACGALKPLLEGGGRLITIFGAGGDRDATKRPLMAVAAGKESDILIITDDNPRSEDPATIRAQVAAGAPTHIETHQISPREDAIAAALNMATEKDIILLAGKGHETGQIIKGEILPFDDRKVAQELLETYS